MEWIIASLLVAPAFWLAMSRSSWLLDYVIAVIAFNRGIRRMVDYYFNGGFNPLSPISLTPLLAASLLLIPALLSLNSLHRKIRLIVGCFAGAIVAALAVGLVLNGFSAIYSFAEWMSSLGALAFATTQRVTVETANRWIKTAGWAAMGVAAYGWWQYYTIPPWDGAWLVESGMVGYMGQPEPTQMTVFSTMQERGPCGTFLAWAVLPMILDRRWRNAGGWFSVMLLLSAIVLTETRSNLIVIAVVAIMYPALSKGRGIFQLITLTSIFVAASIWGLGRIPGMDKISERFGKDSLYGESSSLEGRVGIYQSGLRYALTKPAGRGLGSSGMAKRIGGDKVITTGDSGYVQILLQFGWLGAALFFGALWRIWLELNIRWQVGTKMVGVNQIEPFVPATRAILLGSLVFLFVGDIFAGFSLIWVFFGRAISPNTDYLYFARLHLARRQGGGTPRVEMPNASSQKA